MQSKCWNIESELVVYSNGSYQEQHLVPEMVKHVKALKSSRSIGRPSQVVPSHGYESSLFAALFGDVRRPNPVPEWPQDRWWLSRPGQWPHGRHGCEVFCGGRGQFQKPPCTGERCKGAAQRFQTLWVNWKLGRDGWMMWKMHGFVWCDVICASFIFEYFWEWIWNRLQLPVDRG